MKKIIYIVIFFFVFVFFAFSQHINYEVVYQEYFAEVMYGATEFRLDDNTRVDILTEYYAIEVDFATKWAEAIGQALFYAAKTNSKPGILLIMEYETDTRYLERLLLVISEYIYIKIWTINADFEYEEIN